jgi:hypothetical protein
LLEAPLVGAENWIEPSDKTITTLGSCAIASAPLSSNATGLVDEVGTGVVIVRLLMFTVMGTSPDDKNHWSGTIASVA